MKYLTTEELADEFHVSDETVRAWRRKGQGPRWFRAGGRRILYDAEDVAAWAEARKATPEGTAA